MTWAALGGTPGKEGKVESYPPVPGWCKIEVRAPVTQRTFKARQFQGPDVGIPRKAVGFRREGRGGGPVGTRLALTLAMHLENAGRKTPDADVRPHFETIRVDCRARAARDVFLQVFPLCLTAAAASRSPVLVMTNLGLLQDSVIRLPETLERLAADIGAKFELEDRSGLSDAHIRARATARPNTAPGRTAAGEEK